MSRISVADRRAARFAGQQDRESGALGRVAQAARLDRLARALGTFERDEPATGIGIHLTECSRCRSGLTRLSEPSRPSGLGREARLRWPPMILPNGSRRCSWRSALLLVGSCRRSGPGPPAGQLHGQPLRRDPGRAGPDRPRRGDRRGRDPDVPGPPVDRHGRRRGDLRCGGRMSSGWPPARASCRT